MKLLKFLSCFLFCISLNAQSFISEDKLWLMREGSDFPGNQTEHLTYNVFRGTMTHNGKVYNKLYSGLNKHNLTFKHALRETDDGKVFFLYGDEEYLAYDFQLKKGDVFDSGFSKIVVKDVETITTLDGKERQQHTLNYEPTSIHFDLLWIDGMGGSRGTFAPQYAFITDNFNEVVCYLDNNEVVWASEKFGTNICDDLVETVSSTNTLESKFKLYAANRQITIEDYSNNSELKLKLFNTAGKMILDSKFQKNSVSINQNIPSGIYVYNLIEKSELIQSGKILIK